MVDRYYTWFFNNYNNYRYTGPKAKAVLKSIEDFIAKNDPNIYNFNTMRSKIFYSWWIFEYRYQFMCEFVAFITIYFQK